MFKNIKEKQRAPTLHGFIAAVYEMTPCFPQDEDRGGSGGHPAGGGHLPAGLFLGRQLPQVNMGI